MLPSVQIVAKSSGRPSAVTQDVTRKLVAAFERGLSDTEACDIAGIGRTTFYKYLKEDEAFTTQIVKAKHFASMLAAEAVFDVLLDRVREQKGEKKKYSNGLRAKLAMWYLERKAPESYGSFVCKEPCCQERRWKREQIESGELY